LLGAVIVFRFRPLLNAEGAAAAARVALPKKVQKCQRIVYKTGSRLVVSRLMKPGLAENGGAFFVGAIQCPGKFGFINSLLALAACMALAGCGNQPETEPPLFVGNNYAAVTINHPVGEVSHVASLSLCYYPDGPEGQSSLVWPYLTAEDEVVFDQLVVFNGGLSDDMSWKYYPALLAYSGGGSPVEISLPACRHIPDWKPPWTNYAFSVHSISNDFVRLDASQRLPIQTNRPKRLEVDLSKSEILKIVLAAQTNGQSHTFSGVKYFAAD
jgi:hypothetical protein